MFITFEAIHSAPDYLENETSTNLTDKKMSDFKPMNACKGFNMERVLLKNKNGYMITAYLKDGMLQCDGDEAWSHPICWDGFIRLQELANKPTTSTEPSIVNEPVLSVVISVDWLMEKHPELQHWQAALLLQYCKDNTITHKECYGNGEIMYKKWRELQ